MCPLNVHYICSDDLPLPPPPPPPPPPPTTNLTSPSSPHPFTFTPTPHPGMLWRYIVNLPTHRGSCILNTQQSETSYSSHPARERTHLNYLKTNTGINCTSKCADTGQVVDIRQSRQRFSDSESHPQLYRRNVPLLHTSTQRPGTALHVMSFTSLPLH